MKYAANNRQIASALGLNPHKRGVLADIGLWLKDPEFPKKERRGWPVEKVRAWHKSFIARAPLFSPEELLESRRAALRAKFAAGKPLSREDKAELRNMGLLPLSTDDAEAAPEPVTDSPLGFAQNQAALTEKLARHFGQRAGIILSENKVSEWLRGKGLPTSAPLPPTKIRGRFNVQEWANWIEQWIIVRDASGQTEMDLGRLADTYIHKKAIADGRLKEIELENAEREHSAKWILRAVASATMDAFVAKLLAIIRHENERADVVALREYCRTLQLPEDVTGNLCGWLTQRAIARMTAIEDGVAGMSAVVEGENGGCL